MVKLANRQQPGVGTDRLGAGLDNDRLLWEKMKLNRFDRLFKHYAASVAFQLVLKT